MKKIAILYGGISSEKEVSKATGKAILSAVSDLGYEPVPIEVTENVAELIQKLTNPKVSVAIIALHGRYAEEGTIQGILEYCKIPYTGSGVMASAIGMNKSFTKKIVAREGVPVAKDVEVTDIKDLFQKVSSLTFPVVVKPNSEGSSVGVSIVERKEDLEHAVSQALMLDRNVLIEEFIPGIETSVSIFHGEVFDPIEISPKAGFYSYKNKYTAGSTEYFIPARVSESAIKNLKENAMKAFNAVGCRQYGRVDFRVHGDVPYILEINTLPGCTETSLLPKALQFRGISFKDFIQGIIETARCDYSPES